MSDYHQVAWSEGMFLRPQHFQQQERALLFQLRQQPDYHPIYRWGLMELTLDHSFLANGQIGVQSLAGCFQDGTTVLSPQREPLPQPLKLDPTVRDQIIYLAVAVDKTTEVNVSASDKVTRYQLVDQPVVDTCCLGDEAVETLQLLQMNLSLKLEGDNFTGYQKIALAKVHSVSAQGQVTLDPQFIPAWLNSQQNPQLMQVIQQIHGILGQRAEALAARLGQGQGNTSSVADFLMLQLLNRYDARLTHVLATTGLHPESLYQTLATFAAELATFTQPNKRPVHFSAYQHDQLSESFAMLSQHLCQMMGTVLEQTAIELPLSEVNYGIRVAQIEDRSLLQSAAFILAVQASMSEEQLRQRLPEQVKIAPVEHIRELVNNQLAGIAVTPLPVAPRQIPYLSGYHYFKLDHQGEYWQQLSTSGGLAVHLSGQYPELMMQLWAIHEGG